MPTNRPIFSNFLAAFRAQSVLQKAATSTSTSATAASTTQASFAQSSATSATSTLTAAANVSGARSISTKATSESSGTGATSMAIQSGHQFQPTRQHAASPYSRSPGSPGSPAYPSHTPIGGAASRQRRGSDSSSEGFRDTLGSEKWYIGGRAPNGEERFYKLSMVKRPRSVDRLSMDRLSL
ncbi:hypothetical protein NA57DRAFT_77361 [Rhizodiscina lignyota]|uniref:Uncharacterized protein n=1 Tax=Rhizodiscina lignyota TaxID=1504668 RepID=A0A9P4M3V1_9PEZI|nr:hypothetical protein NA57DRAFT_77361 [Rhizodiscina lignyota]